MFLSINDSQRRVSLLFFLCSFPPFADELDFPLMINRVLPQDIRVVGWAPVPVSFDARFSCVYRTYKYFFMRQNMDLQVKTTRFVWCTLVSLCLLFHRALCVSAALCVCVRKERKKKTDRETELERSKETEKQRDNKDREE